MNTECNFTHNIAEQLECSQDGRFDFNGFAINECPKFPCEKYKRLSHRTTADIRLRYRFAQIIQKITSYIRKRCTK